ncbi:MAG: glutamine synthetase beta-grasp domain-containing protein, partial [Chloroflexi bacterium]|nr:glutamine synthetase beta-grasp domain-containing protein [Chloroflexota bacterium]
MSPKEAVKFAKDQGVKIVDVKFIDLPGTWQHFSIPVEDFNEDLFVEGLGFDGSSIRGFQQIHESDMLLLPDPNSVVVDPVCKIPTLSL